MQNKEKLYHRLAPNQLSNKHKWTKRMIMKLFSSKI